MKGLEWAWRQGIKKLRVQSDAEDVVHWINGGPLSVGPFRPMLLRCRHWLSRDWDITLRYVIREQNQVADSIAKLAWRNGIHWVDFIAPPQEIVGLLAWDARGIAG